MKLEEIEKICDEATPGPWDFEYGVSLRSAWAISSGSNDVLRLDGSENIELDSNTDKVEQNMEFIAMARTELPKLLAVAKAARIFKNHICGLLAWSGKCNACNEFGAALEELEKE